jgi:peptidoglycan glycosyltransferase
VPRKPSTGGIPADARGHVVTAVRAELEDLGITEQELSQAGLRITTTVDPVRQRAAVEAAHAGLAGQPVNLRSAMVAVDPATGGVLAYYGGDNGAGLDYARVRRLAGSTFKPFVVLAGLRADPPIGLGETFDGAARPGLRNAEGAECARCDLKQAMTVSNNVVFSVLARRVGPQKVADAARAAGITSPLDDPNEGIALGNKEVSTLELASAYATIADGGVWRPPHLVSQVLTADGRVLYQASPEGERRFPEQVARNVTEAMLAVADRDGLGLGRRPVAAKTGTVQSRFPGENNDAWMAGFTPQLAASVWMGTDRNSPIRTASGDPISGRTLPGEVWQGFMASALHDAPAEPFTPFRPLGTPPSDAPPNAPVTPTAPPTAARSSAAPARDPGAEDLPDGDDPAADPAVDGDPAHGDPAHSGPATTTQPTTTPPVTATRRGPGRPAPVGERPGLGSGGPGAAEPDARPHRVRGAGRRLTPGRAIGRPVLSRPGRRATPRRRSPAPRWGPAGRRGPGWPRSARRSARPPPRPTPPPRRAPCRTARGGRAAARAARRRAARRTTPRPAAGAARATAPCPAAGSCPP